MNKMTIGSFWDPSKLATAMWLDASDANTITESANAVSQWDDKSGNGRNLVQPTAAYQPTTNSTTINGLNSIYFDGANDGLSTVAAASWLNNTEFTVIAVTKEHTWNTENSFMNSVGNTDPLGDFDIGRGASLNDWDFRRQAGDSGVWVSSTPTSFVPILSATQYQNTGSQLWMFGEDFGAISKPLGSVTGIDQPLNIGRPDLSSFSYAGNMGEVLIVTGTLSTDDRQKLEGFLSWKWGTVADLPIGHPYKTSGVFFGY